MSFLTLLYSLYFYSVIEDTEKNLDPRKLEKSLSVCHWNLDILQAHNFSKLAQLKADISMWEHDFISLTYLESSVPDSLLKIDGYD